MGVFRRIRLLLTVVMLCVWGGTAWGAASATFTADPAQGVGAVNNASNPKTAKVYFYTGTTVSPTISVNSIAGLTTNDGNTVKLGWKDFSGAYVANSLSTASTATVSSNSIADSIDTTIPTTNSGTFTCFLIDGNANEGSLDFASEDIGTLTLTAVSMGSGTFSLNLNTVGSSVASMDFTKNTPATKTVSVANTLSLPNPSFDLSVGSLTNGTDPWGAGASGLTASWTSKDVSFAGTATADQSLTTFNVKTTKVVIAGDGNAVVAGISTGTPKDVGNFTARVNDFNITLSSPDLSFYVARSVDVTVSVEVAPLSTALTELTLSSTDFNGLHLVADKNAKTIKITGTPVSTDISGTVVVVTAKNSDSAVATANLKIKVSQYGLTLSPSIISGTTDDNFMKTVNVSVTPDNSIALNTLTVKYATFDVTGVELNGLTVSTDAAGKTLSVTGTPEESGLMSYTVSATSNAGTIADATLIVQISQGNTYKLTLTDQNGKTVQNIMTLKGRNYDQTFTVSASSSVGALTSLKIEEPSTWNGLTVTTDLATKKIHVQGTPLYTGHSDFKILATAQLKKIQPFLLRAVTIAAGEDGLIQSDPAKILLLDKDSGRQSSYNGNNFNVGVEYRITFSAILPLENLSITLTSPDGSSRTLVLGTDFTVERNWNDMSIFVHMTPGMEGGHLLTFNYDVGSQSFTQAILLDARYAEPISNGGSSGCNGLSLTLFSAILLPLFLRKRS